MQYLDQMLASQVSRWEAMTDDERDAETFAWWDRHLDECERLRYTSKNLILDLILDRTRRRHSAIVEYEAIDAAHRRVVFNMKSTDLELDAAEATYEAALAQWHARYDSLWPDEEMESARQKINEERARYQMKTEGKSAKIPLADTQRTIAALGQPILDELLSSNSERNQIPVAGIRLPDTLSDHPLFELINEAIKFILRSAELPKQFRQDKFLPTLAVLYSVHEATCERLHHRIISSGAILSSGRFDSAVKSFESKVRREVNTAAGFFLDSKGRPAADNSDNVHVFIRQAGKRLRRNEWFERNEIADIGKENWCHLDDDLKGDLLVDAENSQFDYHPTVERFKRALNKIARETPYDPVLERIDSAATKWDGTSRLDAWLHMTCGVPNDAYHAAVSRNIIGGMIRRARHPGCKHDECAILISPDQGKGKSTIAETLALDPDWFTDTIEIGGRKVDVIPEMRGKWVIELQELAGMSKTEVEKVKAFISTKKDNATLKYKEEASEPARRCIFLGTSNSRRPLRDESGNRRFLPVHVVGEVDLGWLRANVEQLIGEAAVREANGQTFGIPKHLWSVAGEHQEAARQLAPIEEHIIDLLGPFRCYACKVASGDILEALRFRKCNDNKIGAAMNKLGFTQPDKHDRVWISKTATGSAKEITALRLHRTLHEVTFLLDGKQPLPPPPY